MGFFAEYPGDTMPLSFCRILFTQPAAGFAGKAFPQFGIRIEQPEWRWSSWIIIH
jgi:hypothetical protein